jgi:hypothetical protein
LGEEGGVVDAEHVLRNKKNKQQHKKAGTQPHNRHHACIPEKDSAKQDKETQHRCQPLNTKQKNAKKKKKKSIIKQKPN